MKRALVIVSVLLVAACGFRGGDDPGRDVVAVINGEPVSRTDLDLYFRVNLLEPSEPESSEGPPDADALDRVRSRLFDAFIEEQTLLAEARRREIQVSRREVEEFLDLERVEGDGVTDLSLEARRRLARARLLIEKLQEQITAEIAPPTDEDVERYAATADGLPTVGKRVLLRVLPFESAETAQKVYSDIRRDRTTFAEAAQQHETQPGQASPQEIGWDRIPEPVREVLEDLKPGEVSAPLDHNGLVYLFQVQAWLEDSGWLERERLRVARQQLIRRNGVQATLDLMKKLKETSKIQLRKENLGFRYVPEPGT